MLNAKSTYPETYEAEISRTETEAGPEVVSGFFGANQDGTFTVFFTYEGPDDRFIFGVKRNVSFEEASAVWQKRAARAAKNG